jgi:hypothetical protein
VWRKFPRVQRKNKQPCLENFSHTIGESKKFEEKWQSQFEKLKEYQRINGDCNVPRNWKEIYSLGIWVYNQRKQYRRMKTGESIENPDRFQKLDQLGFGSSVNDATKKENGSNRGSQK